MMSSSDSLKCSDSSLTRPCSPSSAAASCRRSSLGCMPLETDGNGRAYSSSSERAERSVSPHCRAPTSLPHCASAPPRQTRLAADTGRDQAPQRPPPAHATVLGLPRRPLEVPRPLVVSLETALAVSPETASAVSLETASEVSLEMASAGCRSLARRAAGGPATEAHASMATGSCPACRHSRLRPARPFAGCWAD